jgi:hypothetical protein
MAEIILALLIGCNLILTAAVFKKVYWHTAEQKLDAAVERSLEEAEAQRRSREMDEGFDNLMRFSVRGNDGFGGV